jgi:hypothetical protein
MRGSPSSRFGTARVRQRDSRPSDKSEYEDDAYDWRLRNRDNYLIEDSTGVCVRERDEDTGNGDSNRCVYGGAVHLRINRP